MVFPNCPLLGRETLNLALHNYPPYLQSSQHVGGRRGGSKILQVIQLWNNFLSQSKYREHRITLKPRGGIRTKNDRNGGIGQSRISESLAEYVQHHVYFVNVQSCLHENVIFSVCACMDNVAYIIFIIWNFIGRSHKEKIR